MKLQLLAFAALVAAAVAECPNACSGHGECGNNDQCICYDGFVGGDCSARVCPFGLSFVDVPAGDLNHDGLVSAYGAGAAKAYSKVQWSKYNQPETWPALSSVESQTTVGVTASSVVGGAFKAQAGEAHFYSECSGKGSCDRATGTCKCFDGFTGASCQRTTCPNDCSGHGLCLTVEEIAAGSRNKRLVDSVSSVNTYSGVTSSFTYNLWDAEKHRACVCDAGYSGIDCSLRECPRGDDPLTHESWNCANGNCKNEKQAFNVPGAQTAVTYALIFTDYNGASYKTSDFTLSTGAITAATKAANEAAVAAALLALPNNVTGTVKVTSSFPSSSGGSASAPKDVYRVVVEFTSKSGNVPAMRLVAGSGATKGSLTYGAQPSTYVQVFSLTSLASKTMAATVYPKTAIPATATTSVGSLTISTAANAASTVASVLNSVPALYAAYGNYFAADLNVVVHTAASPWVISVAFPDEQFGSMPIGLSWNNAAITVSMDTNDGTKEYSTCSNRGVCDYSKGICKCFTGHTGAACETQSALAL